jgi:hypothetical protein
MSDQQVEQIKKEIWQAYLDRTKASQAHNKTAKQSMPGGTHALSGSFNLILFLWPGAKAVGYMMWTAMPISILSIT